MLCLVSTVSAWKVARLLVPTAQTSVAPVVAVLAAITILDSSLLLRFSPANYTPVCIEQQTKKSLPTLSLCQPAPQEEEWYTALTSAAWLLSAFVLPNAAVCVTMHRCSVCSGKILSPSPDTLQSCCRYTRLQALALQRFEVAVQHPAAV